MYLALVKSEFEDSRKARWLSQVCGTVMSGSAGICLLVAIHSNSNHSDNLFMASICLYAIMIFIFGLVCFGNFCIVCFLYYYHRFKTTGSSDSHMMDSHSIKIYVLEEEEEVELERVRSPTSG
jgi:hypothetical protein